MNPSTQINEITTCEINDLIQEQNDLQILRASSNAQLVLSPSLYPQKVFINNGRHLIGINVDDIVYCKANRDFTTIVTIDDKTYLSNKGIGALEQHLDPRQFLRIHRSYLINLKHTTYQ